MLRKYFPDQFLVQQYFTSDCCEQAFAFVRIGRTYSVFTFGLVHKWGYFQRTIPDTAELYQPLEDAIRTKLIPSLTGRSCSDLER